MMAGFHNFYNVKKGQDLVKKGAVCFEQVFKQKKYFGVMGTLNLIYSGHALLPIRKTHF